jgi:hypothetical protein
MEVDAAWLLPELPPPHHKTMEVKLEWLDEAPTRKKGPPPLPREEQAEAPKSEKKPERAKSVRPPAKSVRPPPKRRVLPPPLPREEPDDTPKRPSRRPPPSKRK